MGELQAQALAERLASEPISAVVSSDLARAYTTALAIAQPHHLTVLRDTNLREINMGAWEGKSFLEVEAQDASLFAHWRADPTLYTPPGGETLEQLRERILQALASLPEFIPSPSDLNSQETCVAWVTHSALIGVLFCALLHLPLTQRWQFQSDNASLSEITLQDSNRAIVTCFNDTGHLRARGLWRPAPVGLYVEKQQQKER